MPLIRTFIAVAFLLLAGCGQVIPADLTIRVYYPEGVDPTAGLGPDDRVRLHLRTDAGAEQNFHRVDDNQWELPSVPLQGNVVVTVEIQRRNPDSTFTTIARGLSTPVGVDTSEKRTVGVFVGMVGEFGIVGRMPQARAGHSAAVLPDGRVILVGGFSGDESSTPDLLTSAVLYDALNVQISADTIGSLQLANGLQAATPLSDGRIVFTGGQKDADDLQGHVFIFDPGVNGFEQPLPAGASPRINHSAAEIPGGVLLVGGGDLAIDIPNQAQLTPLSANSQVFRTEGPDVGSVTAIGSPWARAYGSATRVQDGKVLLYGGICVNGDANCPMGAAQYQSVAPQLFDPGTNQAPEILAGSTRRFAHADMLLGDGTVWLSGGYQGPGTADNEPLPIVPISNVDLYRPATNTFTSIATLQVPRARHAVTRMADGSIFSAGGIGRAAGDPCDGTAFDAALSSAEIYELDPVSAKLVGRAGISGTCLATLGGTGRIGHSATLLPNGTILIAGGWTDIDPVTRRGIAPADTIEIYVPE